MEKYLKPYQHYSDRYDRSTVEQCRWWRNRTINAEEIMEQAKKLNISQEEAKRTLEAVERFYTYFRTGDRYIKKEETIRTWMGEDEARDNLLETAKAPEDIPCITCGRLMFVSSSHLDIGGLDKNDRVLFFYDCPLQHMPRRAFFHTGEEWRYIPKHCPKCDQPLDEKDIKEGKEKIITISTCLSCGYSETDELDLTSKQKEEIPDPEYIKDRDLFCLSEKQGQEFIEAKRSMEALGKLVDEQKEREKNKETYDKVTKLKKLKIIELEELLTPILEKAGYIKLQFKTPEIDKNVVIPFVVYDQKPDRIDRVSTYDLEKLLRKTLQDTNWRLMSDGTNYRLGMLEGRLKGYEREEDLINLIK